MTDQPDPKSLLETVIPLSAGEILAKTYTTENAIIGSGLLHQGSILVVGGPPKTYKSFLINSIAYHLATGTSLFGATRTPRGGEKVPVFPVAASCKVLILEQEIGERDLQERLKLMVGSLSPAESTLFKEKVFYHSCDHNMRLDDAMGRAYIARIIDHLKPDIVCFDPLIEFHNADENSARDMAHVMHGIDWLRERFPFSTVLVHHISKPGKDDEREGPHSLRGSSVIFGKGDSFMLLKQVRNEEPGVIQLAFTLRRGKPISKMVLKMDFDTLRAQFHYWDKARKDRRDGVISMAEVLGE